MKLYIWPTFTWVNGPFDTGNPIQVKLISCAFCALHDDVIKWKHFPRCYPLVRGIHRSPVNSPHNGQGRRALMLSLICACICGWVNNREASTWGAIALIMTSLWCAPQRLSPCKFPTIWWTYLRNSTRKLNRGRRRVAPHDIFDDITRITHNTLFVHWNAMFTFFKWSVPVPFHVGMKV